MKRSGSTRRTPRRLARHVLLPLLGGGLLLVAALVLVAALTARSAALHELDARAADYRAMAQAAVDHSGRLGTLRQAAAARGDQIAFVSADRPLLPGEAVVQSGSQRSYTFPISGRRIRVTLPATRVYEATRRAALMSGAAGLLLLLLLCALVGSRVRRAASAPLVRLHAAMEDISGGRPTDVTEIGGAAEVTAVAARLGSVAAALADLESQAATDPLTGIANRRSFHRSLQAELKRAKRESRPMTLVL